MKMQILYDTFSIFVGCKMDYKQNFNAANGESQGKTIKSACSMSCLTTPSCLAADWDKYSEECYFHSSTTGREEPKVNSCCDRYVKSCPIIN